MVEEDVRREEVDVDEGTTGARLNDRADRRRYRTPSQNPPNERDRDGEGSIVRPAGLGQKIAVGVG